MDPILEQLQIHSRRKFLLGAGGGVGAAALSTLVNPG